MRVHRIDHVGINVNDLPAAKAFFLDLGLEMMGEGIVEGAWAGRIIGLHDVRSEVVMLRTPNGESKIELSQFHSPTGKAATLPLRVATSKQTISSRNAR